MDGEVQIEATEHGYVCRSRDTNNEYVMVMRESRPGLGDWECFEFTMRSRGATRLTGRSLRDAPHATHIEHARAALRQHARSSEVQVFATPGKPPSSFLVARQGRSARSDRDYAELARALMSFENPAQVPKIWAARYGGSIGTWRNRVTEARRRGFLAADGTLTHEGFSLVYGESVHDAIEHEGQIEGARRLLEAHSPAPSPRMPREERDLIRLRLRVDSMRRPDPQAYVDAVLANARASVEAEESGWSSSPQAPDRSAESG
jgi:hypothetical protein